MILRLLALLVLPVLAWYLAVSISRRFSLTRRQNRILFVITAALLVVGILVVMGRLPAHFIFAPLGAAGAFLLRFLPTLLRLAPLWQMLKSRTASASNRSGNQSSCIRTDFFAMELQHGSGNMDGEVLKGAQAGKKLSDLALSDLLQVYAECANDADSVQVLEAYLDRMHEGWREHADADSRADHEERTPDDATMTRELALEILGLGEGATRDDIVKAHRKLMQKLHPDRGGNDYLAKKINSAKEFLLRQA